MNNITNSPNCDNALFKIDIEELHKKAIEILENWKELDTIQETAICSYANAIVDLYKEDNFPKSELCDPGTVADLIDEMWERKPLLVEDKMFRRAFILICAYVLEAASWPDGEDIDWEAFQ